MQTLCFIVPFTLVLYGPLWLPGCTADKYEYGVYGYSNIKKVTAFLANFEVFTRLDITPCSGIQLPKQKYNMLFNKSILHVVK